jgi:hypothetical protein
MGKKWFHLAHANISEADAFETSVSKSGDFLTYGLQYVQER